MSRAARWGTVLVLAHLLVSLVHGEAHRRLQILLGPREEAFVILVIVLGPVLAMIVMWASRRRWGPLLFTLFMTASLVFGVYKHFVAISPDNVSQLSAGTWSTIFITTSFILLATEATGAMAGIYLLRGDNRL